MNRSLILMFIFLLNFKRVILSKYNIIYHNMINNKFFNNFQKLLLTVYITLCDDIKIK